MLGKIAALVILAGGVWVLLQALGDPGFQVREVTIIGASLVPVHEIQQDLSLEGANVFYVRSGRLERRLRLNPAIERVRVEPHLPNLVSVTIIERTPSVYWEGDDVPSLVDANGLAIRESTDVHALALPRIRAPEGPIVRAGERVDPSPVHIAQSVAPRLDSLGLAGARLEYRPSSGITIVGDLRVAIGAEDNLEAKLVAYQSIRRHLEQSRARAELVDVRFLDRPYYR